MKKEITTKKLTPQVIPPLYTTYPQKLSTYPQADSLFCVRTYIPYNIYDTPFSLSTAYPQAKILVILYRKYILKTS
ncbi:hypothetical protein K1T44_0526 [Listeria innocua]|nr:hypothetical protein K1T44_0526 [Listeria innocua]